MVQLLLQTVRVVRSLHDTYRECQKLSDLIASLLDIEDIATFATDLH